jgi:hypothetical protein
MQMADHPRKQPNWIVGKNGWWQATSGEVKEMFGLKKTDPWPDAGMPKRVVQGFICWIDPIAPVQINKNGREYRPFRIRARMFCGICGDEQPIGRQQQHAQVHIEEAKQEAAQHRYDTTPASEE